MYLLLSLYILNNKAWWQIDSFLAETEKRCEDHVGVVSSQWWQIGPFTPQTLTQTKRGQWLTNHASDAVWTEEPLTTCITIRSSFRYIPGIPWINGLLIIGATCPPWLTPRYPMGGITIPVWLQVIPSILQVIKINISFCCCAKSLSNICPLIKQKYQR